jgi:TonB family protein
MSRFEKKCFVGSASFHGLLLVIFIFGSAFLVSKPKLDIGPVITMLAIPTDKPFNTGGNPNGNPAPPAPAPAPVTPPTPQPQPQPTPQPPEQQPVKHEEAPPKVEAKKLEPKKEPVKEVVKEKGDLPLKIKPDKKETAKKDPSTNSNTVAKPAISTTVVRRTVDTAKIQRELAQQAAREKEQRDAREYAQQVARYNAERNRVAEQVGGIVGGVGKSLSHSTVVEPLGPGGIAFANYGSMVREAYDRAWHVSQDLSDNDSVAVARITIRRDGTVRDSIISRRSGNPLLDKSVQRALDAVRFVAPFPESTKDAERTFNIEFNLKTRKAVG